MINKAIEFCIKKHKGQFRRFLEQPYCVHPIAVAAITSCFTQDKEVITAAYLHDVIEDVSIVSYQDITREFNVRVANLVLELTSDEKELYRLGKAQYLLNKMIAMSDDGLLIKLADRCHNTSGWRTCFNIFSKTKNHIKSLNALLKFIDKYTLETNFILDNLNINRELTPER